MGDVILLSDRRRARSIFARDKARLEAELFGRAGNYEASGARSTAFWKDLFNDGGDAYWPQPAMRTDEINNPKD